MKNIDDVEMKKIEDFLRVFKEGSSVIEHGIRDSELDISRLEDDPDHFIDMLANHATKIRLAASVILKDANVYEDLMHRIAQRFRKA